MNVLLVHADGKMPNLALMKISAYHKRRRNRVFLKRGLSAVLPLDCQDPDQAYISCIFEKNRARAVSLYEKLRLRCPTEIGGYGVSDNKLPDEIEHIRPDYDLYSVDYSIGFSSRGCIRNCPWCEIDNSYCTPFFTVHNCVVPLKEGDIRDHAPLDEFLHPSHRKLILLDNNFLASPKSYEELRKIIAHKLKVNFNQGLDIRLIDQENAKLLSKTHYYDRKFRNRTLHFGFDLPQIEDEVLTGIEILGGAGIPPNHLMFYVLVGFNTSYQEDMHRINLLVKEGVRPYVMPYNDRHDSYYPHLERWVNGRYYEVVPWEKYNHGNSQAILKQTFQKLEIA